MVGFSTRRSANPRNWNSQAIPIDLDNTGSRIQHILPFTFWNHSRHSDTLELNVLIGRIWFSSNIDRSVMQEFDNTYKSWYPAILVPQISASMFLIWIDGIPYFKWLCWNNFALANKYNLKFTWNQHISFLFSCMAAAGNSAIKCGAHHFVMSIQLAHAAEWMDQSLPMSTKRPMSTQLLALPVYQPATQCLDYHSWACLVSLPC